MIIKKVEDVSKAHIKEYDHMEKRIVIGPGDGSGEIALRYFSIEPGGTSSHHSHDYPHLVKVEKGEGSVRDGTGNKHQLQPGDYVYVPDNETHQFKNTGSGSFEFICVVPARGEK